MVDRLLSGTCIRQKLILYSIGLKNFIQTKSIMINNIVEGTTTHWFTLHRCQNVLKFQPCQSWAVLLISKLQEYGEQYYNQRYLFEQSCDINLDLRVFQLRLTWGFSGGILWQYWILFTMSSDGSTTDRGHVARIAKICSNKPKNCTFKSVLIWEFLGFLPKILGVWGVSNELLLN